MARILSSTCIIVGTILAAACSSAPASTGGGADPASIQIAAGDAQAGPPATALPIHPAVIVRDAAGNVMTGVAVTFHVDSGGGALSAAAASTGSDGIATAGVWTLGPSAGRNTIKVTAGSLAPVTISATASAGSGTVAPLTLGTGGGTYTISDAGPLKGLTLVVPSGAFETTTQATLSYAPATGFPAVAGVTALGPMIAMSTSAGAYTATAPLTMHVPLTAPANSFTVLVMYDPATGAREVLPTIGSDSTGVTAGLSSLSSGNLLGANGAGGLRASFRASESTVYVIPVAISEEALMADFDTGFRPGANDWEFSSTAGALTATQLDSSAAPAFAMPVAAVWYFATRASPLKLFKRFQLAAGVPGSDRAGLRWISVLGKAYGTTVSRAAQQMFLARVDGNAAKADYRQFLTVRAAFALGQGAPQPQLIYLTPRQGLGAGLSIPPLIVYKAVGGTLAVADPEAPGDLTKQLTFTESSGMQPYGSGIAAANAPVSMGLTSQIPVSILAATYPKVVDGTIGNGAFYSYQFRSKYGTLGDTVWSADSLRVWMECAQCSPRITSTQAPEATSSVTALDAYSFDAAAWKLIGSAKVLGFTVARSAPAEVTQKAVQVSWATNQDAHDSTEIFWMDWHPFTFVHLRDTVSVTPLTPTGNGTPFTLKQLPTGGPLPTHVTYTWDFGDNTSTASLTDNASVQHTFAAPGVYLVKAQILDARTTQPIATTTLVDTVRVPFFVWKLVSTTAPVISLPSSGIGNIHADTSARDSVTAWVNFANTSPLSTLIFVSDSANCQGISLEEFPSSAVVDTGWIQSALRGTLGLTGTGCYNPAFVTVTFAMGTFGSGALTGSVTPVPAGVSIYGSINATMSGNSLDGSFTLHVNFITHTEGSENTSAPGTFTVNFHAVLVQPRPLAGLRAGGGGAGP